MTTTNINNNLLNYPTNTIFNNNLAYQYLYQTSISSNIYTNYINQSTLTNNLNNYVLSNVFTPNMTYHYNYQTSISSN